jgi:ABC-type Fe3+-siderophore transport system permease subunit
VFSVFFDFLSGILYFFFFFTRELDKRVKKVKQLSHQLTQQKTADEKEETINTQTNSRLPWVLLALSWGLFLIVAGIITLAK